MLSQHGRTHHGRWQIGDHELEGLQAIAADLLARTPQQLDEAVADGALQEICQ